jgi:hypothetical protein
VSIAAISAERPFDRPAMVEVFAALLNFNQHEVACDIQLSVDGTARGIREVVVPPARLDEETGELRPGRNNVAFAPFELALGAVIEVANLRPDDLMVDNVAQVVIPPPRRLNVAIVSPQGWVLREAVAAMGPARLDTLTRAQYEELAAQGPLDEYDVIIFDDYAPEHLPGGRYLAFGAPPPIEGLNPYGRADRQIILTTRDLHPVMLNVNMDNVFITSFQLLQPARDVEILAEGNQSPAVVFAARGPITLLYVPFNPLDSNWPFLRSYPMFVYNAVEFLGHFGEAVADAGLRPGQALTTRLPSDATDIRLIKPDGRIEPLNVPDPAQMSWGPITRSGVHVLSWREPGREGEQMRSFAVNLLSDAARGKANFFILEHFEKFQSSVNKLYPNAIAATEIIEYDIKYAKLISYILDDVYIVKGEYRDIPEDNNAIFITESGKITKRKFSLSGGSVGLFEGKRIGRAKNLEKLEKEIKELNKKQ